VLAYKQFAINHEIECMKLIAFEEAISYTETLLSHRDLDEAIFESEISELVQLFWKNGAMMPNKNKRSPLFVN
jgi:hypothetical protein